MIELSYSQIDTYLRCKKKWYYAYVERLTPIEPSENLLLGSAVHAGAAAYYAGKQDDEVLQIAKDAFLKEQSEVAIGTLEIPSLLPVLVKRFIEDSRKNDPIWVEVYPELEIRFEFLSHDIVRIVGRLDALAADEHGRRYILELKTSSQPRAIINNLPFNLQNKLYCFIMQKNRTPVDAVRMKILRKAFKSAEPLIVSDCCIPETGDAFANWINNITRDIIKCKEGDVPILESYQYSCYTCQYKSLCSETDPELQKQYRARDFTFKKERDIEDAHV